MKDSLKNTRDRRNSMRNKSDSINKTKESNRKDFKNQPAKIYKDNRGKRLKGKDFNTKESKDSSN